MMRSIGVLGMRLAYMRTLGERSVSPLTRRPSGVGLSLQGRGEAVAACTSPLP